MYSEPENLLASSSSIPACVIQRFVQQESKWYFLVNYLLSLHYPQSPSMAPLLHRLPSFNLFQRYLQPLQ